MLKVMSETSLTARGVAMLPTDTDQAELESSHRTGIRGVRYNLLDVREAKSGIPLAKITAFAERLQPMGWHVEFLVHVDDYPDFASLFRDFPTEIVVAHHGYFRPGCALDNPGFQDLLELAESGRCWLKLTGAYRVAVQELPYADVDPFAEALVTRAQHRLLWGSDWPHVMMKKTMPDDGHLADILARHIPDKALRTQILVDNPVQLYQF